MVVTAGESTELDRLARMVQWLLSTGGLLVAVTDAETGTGPTSEELKKRLDAGPNLVHVAAAALLAEPGQFTETAVLLDGWQTSDSNLRDLNTSREFLLDEKVLVVLILDSLGYVRAMEQAPDFLALKSSEFFFGLTRRLKHVSADLISVAEDVVSEAKDHEDNLTRFLRPERVLDEDYLLVLRQWNSFTPILSPREPEPRGGGYYLNWRGTGIVVDPGHDFVHNLYSANLGVADVDAVVMTHDHCDHTQDFSPLLDLAYQLRARPGGLPEHRLRFYLNLSTFERFSSDLKSLDPTAICEVLYPGKVVQVKSRLVQLRTMAAKHAELGNVKHAVSLRFDLHSPREVKPLGLVFTGDTGYHTGLADLVEKTEVVVAHIGTVKEDEVRLREPYHKHLGILGCTLLAQDALRAPPRDPTLMLLSEFGEELLNARLDLARIVTEDTGVPVVAADIGTRVRLDAGARCFVACDYRQTKGGNICGVPATQTYTNEKNRLTHRCVDHPYVRKPHHFIG